MNLTSWCGLLWAICQKAWNVGMPLPQRIYKGVFRKHLSTLFVTFWIFFLLCSFVSREWNISEQQNSHFPLFHCLHTFSNKEGAFLTNYNNCCYVLKFKKKQDLSENLWVIHQTFLLIYTKMHLIILSHIWLCPREVAISPNNNTVNVRCFKIYWNILRQPSCVLF